MMDKYFKKYSLNNKLYLIIAGLGIILALILTFSAPFKDRILSTLFPKPASEAAKPIKPTPTPTPTPTSGPTPTPTPTAESSAPGPKIKKFVAKVKNVKANQVIVATPTEDITIPTDTNTSFKAWVYTQGLTNPPTLQSSSKSALKVNQRVNVEKIEVVNQPVKYEVVIFL